MPFKPKPPPPILRIESLSTGREFRPLFLENDLEPDKPIPVPPDDSPIRQMKSGNELLNEIKRKEIEDYKQVLVVAGLGNLVGHKPEPKLVAPELPGMRPVTKLGNKLVISIPKDPIRRW